MNDLRSLEGIGELLSQKFNQNNKHKLRSRHNRRNSDSLISSSTVSTPTPTTLSSTTTTPISEYFPLEIASLLSNNIQMGYYSNIPSQAPALLKSHSDFVREDMINYNINNISDSDTNNINDNTDQKCIVLNLPIENGIPYINNTIMEREQSLSMTLAPPPSLAPLILEDDYSNNDNFSSINDINNDINNDIIFTDIFEYADSDEYDDDIELIDIKNDYMLYQNSITFNNIGNGASGIVKKAFNYYSCKMVAIKQCRSKQKQEQDLFIAEGKLYNKFRYNNNIINCEYYGKNINDNDLYIVLEYMDLGSVEKLKIYNYKNKQKELIVAYIIMNVLNGINELHKNLYIHNDIKGANILCNKYGLIKLSDFGTVGKLDDKYGYKTKNNGTQMYQSPEKLTKNICKYNAKTDIWSLGVTAYELLFGPRNDDNELTYITSPPILIPEQCGLSFNCCDFINKCLIINDKERLSSDELLLHPFINNIKKHKLNVNIWPWLVKIKNNNNGSIGSPQPKNKNKNKFKFKRRSLTDLRHHEYYNEDLLFMISALIIHYSKQNVNLNNNNQQDLHRRISNININENNSYSDYERIQNMAYYALCNTQMVTQRIRVTVAYIKTQLNKTEISRIDS